MGNPWSSGGSPTEVRSPAEPWQTGQGIDISRTFFPTSRKYSAIDVATYAARILIRGCMSEAATTTTDAQGLLRQGCSRGIP